MKTNLRPSLVMATVMLAALNVSSQNAVVINEADIIQLSQQGQIISDTAVSKYSNDEAVKYGANISWDLSQLTSDKVDPVEFVSPSATSNGNMYPQSNLCAATPLSQYSVYFEKTATDLSIDGIVGDVLGLGVALNVTMTPSQTLLTFPSTYQTGFADTSVATASIYYGQNETFVYNNITYTFFIDSMKTKRTFQINSEIDGYGTLTTPAGTFDVLRQKVQEVQVDTDYAYVQGTGWYPWQYGTVTQYKLRWWAKTIGYPVLDCEYNPTNNKASNFNYLTIPTVVLTTSINDINLANALKIYPNPSTGKFSIESNGIAYNRIEIYNIMGEKVLQQTSKDIDITNSPKGIYFVEIYDGDKMYTEKIIVQ